MRTAQAARRLLHVGWPEDIPVLRAAIDEDGPSNLTDYEIAQLYHRFSDEEHFAGWMNVDERLATSFAGWIRRTAEKLEEP